MCEEPRTVHTYHEAKDAFSDALRLVSPDVPVPACRGWVVRDLLAHQVHQLTGALDGSFPLEDALQRLTARGPTERTAAGKRQDAWIAAGVARFRRQPIIELEETWTRLASDAPALVLDALVPDVVVHLFDLLGVLRSTELRDHPMVEEALAFWADAAEVPIPEDGAMRFEALRAITGRRSREQVRWLKDDAALYGWRPEPLEEDG
jgi:hypothetical protein